MVNSEFDHDENRLLRSQPTTPTLVDGGGRSGWGVCVDIVAQRSISWMRLLYQFMNAEISRLIVRYTAMVMAMTSTAWPV